MRICICENEIYFNILLMWSSMKRPLVPKATGRWGSRVLVSARASRSAGTSQVTEGLDVLAAIDAAFVDAGGRPLQNVRIRHTIVLDDPFDDPPQLAEHVPDTSPVPVYEQARHAGASRGSLWSCMLGPEPCVCAHGRAGGRSLAAVGAAQQVLQHEAHCRLPDFGAWAQADGLPFSCMGQKPCKDCCRALCEALSPLWCMVSHAICGTQAACEQ